MNLPRFHGNNLSYLKVLWNKYMDFVQQNRRLEKQKKKSFLAKEDHSLNGYDTCMGLVFLLFSAFSRFWVPQNPRYITKPEETSIVWINNFLKNSFYPIKFPPLGMVFESWVAQKMFYDFQLSNSTSLIEDTIYISLRSISCFFSLMFVPLFYYLLRYFNNNRYISFSISFLILFDHTFIAPTRYITDHGFTLFFSGLSLLIIAISQQFPFDSISQHICLILHILSASLAYSSSYQSFPILLFNYIWPIVKYGRNKQSMKQVFIQIIISLIILYISFIQYAIYTPRLDPAYKPDLSKKYQLFFEKKSMAVRFSLFSCRQGLELMIRSFISFFKESFSTFSFGLFLRRFLLIEQSTELYRSDICVSYCIQNNLVLIPAVILLLFEELQILLTRKNDFKSYFVKYALLSLFLYALLCHGPDNTSSYIPTLFVYLALPICLERIFHIQSEMIFLIFLIFLGGLGYFGWGPIVYAYTLIKPPFIPPFFI